MSLKTSRSALPAEAKLYTPAQQTYLDGVRVVATHLVVFEHCKTIFGAGKNGPYAHLGVTLFFVLSGFLIFGSAWRRPADGPQLMSYLADRSARIFTPLVPALLLAVLANELLTLHSYGQPGVNRGPAAFLGNLLLLNDYPLFQAASQFTNVSAFYLRSYNAAEPFWTIPIEYWTYVAFGAFFFCAVRGERVKIGLLAALVAISFPVFLWNAFAGGGHTLSLIWLAGALLAYFWVNTLLAHPRQAWLGFAIFSFGAAALLGRMFKVGLRPYEFQTSALIALTFFGVFVLLRGKYLPLPGVSAAIRVLASYSYSLYLMHNLILVIFSERLRGSLGAAAPWLSVLAAHAVALALYLAFERHHPTVARWLKTRMHAVRVALPAPHTEPT